MNEPSETALAIVPRTPTAIVPSTFAEARELSEYLGKSGLLPAAMKGSPANIFAIVAAGAELGIPPMAATRMFYVDERTGIPKLYSEALGAIVASRRDVIEHLIPIEQAAEVATWEIKRRGQAPVRRTWTADMARKAGLIKPDSDKSSGWLGSPWCKYPHRMLSARARQECIRDVAPDLIGGIQTDADDEPISATAPETFARPEAPPPAPAAASRGKKTAQPDPVPAQSPPPAPAGNPQGTAVAAPVVAQEPAKPSPAPIVPPVSAAQPAQKDNAGTQPAPGPAPQAVAAYEASAARVAAASEPEAIDAEFVDVPAPAAPSADHPMIVEFRAALQAARSEDDLKKVRAKFAPWTRQGEGTKYADLFRAEYAARDAEITGQK